MKYITLSIFFTKRRCAYVQIASSTSTLFFRLNNGQCKVPTYYQHTYVQFSVKMSIVLLETKNNRPLYKSKLIYRVNRNTKSKDFLH